MFTSIQHRTIYMNWLDCLAALVHFFYWQNWPWVEKGHITTSSLCRDCKQKDVLTNYQRANKIFSFFSNWSLLSFRLLFNQKKMHCFVGFQCYFLFLFFFMCDCLIWRHATETAGRSVCVPVDSLDSGRKLSFATETPELEQNRKVLKIFPPSFGFIHAFPSILIIGHHVRRREKKKVKRVNFDLNY